MTTTQTPGGGAPTWPWRMLVRGKFRDPWITASAELRDEIFEAWIAQHRAWQGLGCRLIVTMDDLQTIAEPGLGGWNFYAVWEIPDASIVRELLHPFWNEDKALPLSLSTYFALDLVIGKPIITMERDLGGAQPATAAS